MDNITSEWIWQYTNHKNERRLSLHGPRVSVYGTVASNFDNFNFINVVNCCVIKPFYFDLDEIDFSTWDIVQFPDIPCIFSFGSCILDFSSLQNLTKMESLTISRCQIFWTKFFLPENLKYLRIHDCSFDWEKFQIPKDVEELFICNCEVIIPPNFDFSMHEKLTRIHYNASDVQTGSLSWTYPSSICHIVVTGVKLEPFDQNIYPNLKTTTNNLTNRGYEEIFENSDDVYSDSNSDFSSSSS